MPELRREAADLHLPVGEDRPAGGGGGCGGVVVTSEIADFHGGEPCEEGARDEVVVVEFAEGSGRRLGGEGGEAVGDVGGDDEGSDEGFGADGFEDSKGAVESRCWSAWKTHGDNGSAIGVATTV